MSLSYSLSIECWYVRYSYTEEYKRFLSLSLHVDPNLRASVDDLLNDPFIKKHLPESEYPQQPRLEKMLKTVSRPLSLTHLQDFMNKLVHK